MYFLKQFYRVVQKEGTLGCGNRMGEVKSDKKLRIDIPLPGLAADKDPGGEMALKTAV